MHVTIHMLILKINAVYRVNGNVSIGGDWSLIQMQSISETDL